ncbi:hypothetical protein SGHV058 [Glossina pallidipes salivary gland hypertrophy virus]|uniref:Uncharacterized protein n=1 Tax=Glossina hytrovirus (isolate Glossina pallidipes/Ethiopia/Seibersdorf/-) TaxID=379529 RepID=B0YLL2_GHVS|nr:hypothetical protein SGHV058 [Glossina pallidipes salivary gland hypertrophy virus]ABQ08831.1 hypothetical protein SGHV058 [Glossina pallidipes salivary gland hypertrophy virus]
MNLVWSYSVGNYFLQSCIIMCVKLSTRFSCVPYIMKTKQWVVNLLCFINIFILLLIIFKVLILNSNTFSCIIIHNTTV